MKQKKYLFFCLFIGFLAISLFSLANAITFQEIYDYQTRRQVLGATEYVPNGGFESVDANGKPIDWNTFNYASLSAVNTVAHSGSKSFQMKDSNLDTYSTRADSTSFALDPGTYTLSFWYKTENLGALNSSSGLRVSVYGVSNSTVFKGTNDWTFYQKDVTIATAGSYKISIEGYAKPSGTAWVDDVSLTASSGPDATPPTVNITSPAAGSTQSGTITVSANASDNVGVVGVQFKLDGSNLGTEDTSAPYSISWDTATASNGSHNLTAVARDAAGNTATSAAVAITVSNADAVPPVISFVLASVPAFNRAVLTWTTNEQADSQVEYGTTVSYGQTTALDSTLTTSHSVTVSGLSASTLYHFRVKSKDSSGNVAVSGDQTFTTPADLFSSPQCSDGKDNDLDGKIDYPEDLGCINASDPEEFNAPTTPAPIDGLVAGGLLWYPIAEIGPNLLTNSSFEDIGSNSKPVGWADNGFVSDATVGKTGSKSYRLTDANLIPYSQSAYQNVSLKKGSYRIGGWVKLDRMAATTGSGVRLDLSGGGSTGVIKNTSDWQYLREESLAIPADGSYKFQLSAYGEPDGTAWFDDVELREEYLSPIEAFMLYPNYRGYLFDDQSQTIKFDVSINPPVGTNLSDWKAEISILDEANGSTIASQNYSASSNFTATFNSSGLINGKTYLARFKLIRVSDNSSVYEYPPYRISKVSGSVKNTMSISFDENNRILFKGVPKFLLGVYDSGGGYTTVESSWENTLTTTRKLFELPVNVWFNYWLGNIPNNAAFSLMNVLQRHNINYLSNANCFGDNTYLQMGGGWLLNLSNADIIDRGRYPGFVGAYNMDECKSKLAPDNFANYNKIRSLDPDGITFGSGNNSNSIHHWRDGVDLLSMDPYPLYGPEPTTGYNLTSGNMGVSIWTKATKDAVKNSKPIATVIQFFKFTSNSRWPTQAELRNMSYMAITEGANGLFYWSLGVRALAYICDGSSAYYSPTGSTNPVWCQAKIDNFNNLKSVLTELDSLQPALSSIDRNDLLTSNSNSSIHTRVKYANGKGYLIAYNYTNSNQSASFSWVQSPTQVNVYNEGRIVSVSGNSFSDSFTPFQAHVYEITTGAVPPPATPPVISSFTASPSSITAGGSTTLSWSVSGATSLSIDQGIGSVTGSSKSVSPTQTTTYTLTATNSAGSTTKTVTVTVTNPLPVISNLVGSNTTATTTQISWNTNVLTNGQIFYGLTSSYGSSSSLLDNNPRTTTHTATLSNLTPATLYHFKVTSIDALNNSTSSPDFTFTTLSLPAAPAPVISSFTASPFSIAAGGSTTLSWSVSGATSLSIDQGIGSVTGSSKSVSPTQTTTYTLTATGPGGIATKSVTVTVTSIINPPPPASTSTSPSIASFLASPASLATGGSTVLSWTVTGSPAPTLTINNNIGEVTGLSSKTITPAQTTTYTLTAINSAGQATAQVTVNVTAAPPATTPSGGGGGGSPSPSTTPPSTTSSPVTVYIPPIASLPPAVTSAFALRLINHSGTFYLINNSARFGITNPGMLYTYGFEFKDAQLATAQDLTLPTGPLLLPNDGALVKSKEDKTIYLISKGQRHGFVSEAVFKSLGFKFSSVFIVTNPELQALPKATNLDNPNAAHSPGLDINRQGTIYWIGEDNVLHGYPSLTVYNSWHIDNDFSRVVPANPADSTLPIGSLVEERNME